MPILATIFSLFWFVILFFFLLLASAIFFVRRVFRAGQYETRFRAAFAKYHNDEIARMVARGEIWTGQTADQLRDACGDPESVYSTNDVDHIWQYWNGRRVTLRDDKVIGWQ